MTTTFTLTVTLRLAFALLAAGGALWFLRRHLGQRLTGRQYGVIGLTVLTAAIHMVSGANDTLLYLNGVGYLVLLTGLYFLPLGPLEPYRRWGYAALAAYTAVTLAGYFVVHPWGLHGQSWDTLGLFTKAAELLLLALLALDALRGGQPVQRPVASHVDDLSPAPLSPNGHHPLPPHTPALTVSNLRYSYPDKPAVLNGINLNLRPKERVGLIGPNGAGKTTLFMALCGIQKPEAGEIVLFGRPLKHRDFRPEIGLVFQKSDDQLFSPSVRDDVAFGPQNLGLLPAQVEERVAEALAATGTAALAERPPHHLSGGEKRMVSIAGVMAMRPQLVIYDEPSANLDIRARRRLIEFLQAADHAFIVCSHDLEFILEVCDRVLLLDHGQIIADGAPAEVMSDAALMEGHGLERPHSLTPHGQPVPA